MNAQVLVVDDDPVQRRLLKNAIERYGHDVLLAENGRAGLDVVRQTGVDPSHGGLSVIVLDLMMPEMDGLSFLGELQAAGLEVPVIVQTGQGGIDTVVQAMRAGAFDFVVKPVSPERIATSIANALKFDLRDQKGKATRRSRTGQVGFSDIVSASQEMLRVVELAKRASQSGIPVVLEGESGVGKEMVARAIQAGGDRANKPFITVNCGAIPHNLVESILFGHEKGAFTGATERHTGKFVEADGGTLFLDEIGDLPLDVQVKLLRAVQHGEIETVGASRPQKVNVRLISATNRNLIDEVREGRFREDLYYRLNVFPITIPALRRRKEDIPHLVRIFAARFAADQKLPAAPQVSADAMALLTAYDWPGNIRQLENAVFRAVVLSEGNDLTEQDFPQIAAQVPEFFPRERQEQFHAQPTALVSAVTTALAGEAAGAMHSEALYGGRGPLRVTGESVIVSTDETGEIRKLADVEEELIRFALKFYRGQMSQVARKLGIGRSTLYRKLKDYGIDPDDPLRDAA